MITDGTITHAAVSAGGVAPVPLRLPEVEHALQGKPPTADTFAAAAKLAADNANPLPMTAYKVPLLITTIEDVLTRAAGLAVE